MLLNRWSAVLITLYTRVRAQGNGKKALSIALGAHVSGQAVLFLPLAPGYLSLYQKKLANACFFGYDLRDFIFTV